MKPPPGLEGNAGARACRTGPACGFLSALPVQIHLRICSAMTKTPPNILFLFADQHRFDAVGCNGAPVVETHAFTPTSLCSPARASLLTGLYAHNHGLLANMGNFNGVFDRQLLDCTGYSQLLHQRGYDVHHVGKWHLPGARHPAHWGFRSFADDADYDREKSALDLQPGRAREVQRLEWGGNAPFCGRARLPGEHLQEAWAADKTNALLAEQATREKPFMIFTSFFGPHFPYSVPAPYDTLYDPHSVPRWANFDETFVGKFLIQQKEMLRWNASHLTWPDWQRVIAHYGGTALSLMTRSSAFSLSCAPWAWPTTPW